MSQRDKVYTNNLDVRIRTEVSTWQLSADLFAYKRYVIPFFNGQRGNMRVEEDGFHAETDQGFVNADNLHRLLMGLDWTEDTSWHVFVDEDQQFLNSDDALIYGNDLRQIRSTSQVYDELKAGRINETHIFRRDPKTNMFFDVQGQVLPEIIAFSNQEDDRMNDVNYNMKKLVAHLSARGDVVFFKQGSLVDRPETFEDAVFTIDKVKHPQLRGRQAVLFIWSPSRKEAQVLWDAVRADPRVGSPEHVEPVLYEKIFDLDLLGLRACGAALWPVF